VLTVISGRSAAGRRAAASHTAAAATPLVTQEALFAQAGIVAAAGLGELVEAAALLACQPLPDGDRIAIVSNAGGAGVLAADACDDSGLRVAALSKATQRSLGKLLPAGCAVAGPVDTTAAAGRDAFRACLEQVAADDGVDALLVVTVPTAVADLTQAITAAEVAKPMAAAVLDQPDTVRLIRREAQEPSPASGDAAGETTRLPAGGRAVPAYANPEGAARALAHAAGYRTWRKRPRGQVPDLGGLYPADARSLIAAHLATSPEGGWLPPATVGDLLACYQIPLVPGRHARSEDEAAYAAAGLGGTVVLKAEVPGLIHKTEAGAVKLGLHGEQEVRTAFRALAATFGAALTGVLVQPMISGGVELLVGVVQEPVFGPLVVFGIGGVATEVLGDYTARLTPLTDTDADDLIHGVHAAPLLLGHRGTPPVDMAALADVLLRVSRLADDLPEIAELDLNPVIATPSGVHAVDARIRLSPARRRDPFLRRLR
jgi:acyl-CoA synthetase (NDP forming)